MSTELKTYVSVTFTRKTGKIVKTLESLGCALLKFNAVTNTTKSRDTIIFEKDTGKVDSYYEGSDNSLPTMYTEDLGNIEQYCPGLLKAVNDPSFVSCRVSHFN